jgi:glutamate--glyoxylate aminotransferase
MVPIPKYPLYSAAISLFGGTLVPYYLSEEANWQLDFTDLQKSILAARREGITVQGLVLINPGNPTSQCLTEADLKGLIELCIKETLVLLVDEVYQQNIYQEDHPFISARKVLMDMGQPTSSTLELISFHSASKGFLGECGQRGGYFELTNIHPKTVDELYKVASISMGNVSGQILLGLMVKPPQPGTVSYPQYAAEMCYLFTSSSLTDVFVDCHIPFFLVVVLQILFHDMPLSQDLFFFVCKLDVSVNQYWIPYD